MKIVQLTPGTGNFHCGNCLRDHAIVRSLRAMGHDVLMVPLYLPHVVDGVDETDDTPLFFGGINVYLQHKSALFRNTPHWFDNLFNARWLLDKAAARAGMTAANDLADLTVDMLRGEHGRQNKELTKLIRFLDRHGRPDVVCLSNGLLLGLARRIRAELGAAIVCTLSGEDAFLDTLIEPQRTEAWALMRERAAEIDAFVAVSRYYGDVMAGRLEIDSQRMHVVYNGIDHTGFAPADVPPTAPTIGYLARMHHSKGLATLIDAFTEMKRRDRVPGVQLIVAGAKTPADERYVAEQLEKLDAAGCGDDVEFRANVTPQQKRTMLREVHVLSVPATYGESFGLYVLEAWASGVPVVQPRHGAFTELLEAVGAGMLCEPDDAAALADALEMMLLRPEDSARMGRAGRGAVIERFTAERMAAEVADVFAHAARLESARAGAET